MDVPDNTPYGGIDSAQAVFYQYIGAMDVGDTKKISLPALRELMRALHGGMDIGVSDESGSFSGSTGRYCYVREEGSDIIVVKREQ